MLSIMPPPKFKAFDSTGKPLAGGKVYTYVPVASTLKATYADPLGATPNPNPVILDSNEEAVIWLQGFYKIVLTDANNVQLWSVDQISSSPSVATPNAEWLSVNAAFTFISATQFSTAGDLTGAFVAGRRLQAMVSAGTIYATVTSAVLASNVTTVTVACDSGTLDSGLSAVSVGLLNSTNPSAPLPAANVIGAAVPRVDARAYTSIPAAVTAIGANQAVLFIPNTQTISANLTVPSNVTLKFQQGGSLNISTGVTVTVNGFVDAGLFQIFTLNGTAAVTLGSLSYVNPVWFGAKGDGATNNTPAFQAAVTTALSTNANLYIPAGTFLLGSSVNIDRLVDTTHRTFKVFGEGVIYATTAMPMFSTTLSMTGHNTGVSENISFEGLTFRSTGGTVDTYVLDGGKFLRIKFINCFFDTIKCLYSTTPIQTYMFKHNYIKWWSGSTGYYKWFIRVDAESYDVAFIGNWAEAGQGFYRTVSAAHNIVAGVRFVGNLIEGLSGPVIQGGNFTGLSIVNNYFEYNGQDQVTWPNAAFDLNADLTNYGVTFMGNMITVYSSNASNASYWEVAVGTAQGFRSGGNYCSARLYNTSLTPNINVSDDYAVTARTNNPLTERIVDSTFTATLTGCTTSPTGTVRYEKRGNTVSMFIPDITGTSNATTATITGIPAQLIPSAFQPVVPVRVEDNGSGYWGEAIIDTTTGAIILARDANGTAFTASGTKGVLHTTITYELY